MKVKILVKAPYSKFIPGRAPGAQVLEVGDVVVFPDAYAKGLVEAGLAEAIGPVVEEAAQVEAEDAEETEDEPQAEVAAEAEKQKTVVKKRSRSAQKEE